jgi:hypothetical protein
MSTFSAAFPKAVYGLLFFGLLLTAAYFFPWRNIRWGSVELAPPKLITVTGEATERQQNQIAQFTAGVSAVNDNKDRAVAEVNDAMNKLVAQIKEFGIEDKDIQTQNLSIFQGEETFYAEGQPKQRPGQWRVNNSVTITLRDITKAEALTKLLSDSGANNVYGPNFMVDTEQRPQDALLAQAIEDAKKKAEVMAAASGGALGAIISVSEGITPGFIGPVFTARLESGGGGAGPLEQGSSLVTKTVTVTFALE